MFHSIKQLERLKDTMIHRMELVKYYEDRCDEEGISYHKVPNSNNFMFVILVNLRDELAKYLKNKGIETRVIFPKSVPHQPIYNIKESFPQSEWFCKHTLSLPLYASLSKNQIDYVIKNIVRFMNE